MQCRDMPGFWLISLWESPQWCKNGTIYACQNGALFFNGITKETGQITCYCDRLQVTKWLKIQFKTRSLLGCLLCVDTLVYPLC